MLVYMLTKRGYIDGIHVTIYMDPMGMGGDTTPHHFRTRILGPDLSSVTTFCAMPLGLGPGQLAAFFSDRSDSPEMET